MNPWSGKQAAEVAKGTRINTAGNFTLRAWQMGGDNRVKKTLFLSLFLVGKMLIRQAISSVWLSCEKERMVPWYVWEQTGSLGWLFLRWQQREREEMRREKRQPICVPWICILLVLLVTFVMLSNEWPMQPWSRREGVAKKCQVSLWEDSQQ